MQEGGIEYQARISAAPDTMIFWGRLTTLGPMRIEEMKTSSKVDSLLRHLVTTSFKWSAEPIFPLASGRLSDCYIDCKTALSYPEVRSLIGELMVERIDPQSFDVVGGLELGAYPVAIAVSDSCYKRFGKAARVFVVRKQAKGHGLARWIEGDVKSGDRALIVEDVVTSGGSTFKAIERSREAGLEVVRAFAVVDREEGGRKAFQEKRIAFEAVVTLSDLKRYAGSPREGAKT